MSQGSVHEWGRVDEDGNVFVRTADGERAVGQYPAGTPEEALAFFTERFEALSFEVELLEQRIRSGVMSPEEALESVKTVTAQVTDANAVGDLASLTARLEALRPVIEGQREARRAEKAQRTAEAKVAKEKLVAEAEKIAEGNDWRGGANRLRTLLDEWKALPRIDRASDDALWRRFSSARTSYTRRRKVHFAEQHEKREAARERQGAAGQGGRVARRLHRVGPDRGPLPRPDAAVEGRRPRAQGRRRRAVEPVPGRPGHLLRRPRRHQRRARRRVRRQRRGQGEAPRRGRGAAAGHRPRRRQACLPRASPTAGTPPARCRASG